MKKYCLKLTYVLVCSPQYRPYQIDKIPVFEIKISGTDIVVMTEYTQGFFWGSSSKNLLRIIHTINLLD
jgi:hypothetical protein